ncbi:hypothetical protein DH2020_044596 [Rehmannia glutinosa]|uniref:Uncharacterized protein n=1 Tax=Rehmannia glutinosa TaxID=99300 RepID=A0ABR0UGH9_REHGL
MSMVKPGNCWEAVANGIAGDEEFDNILNILDFPMESLEDDGFVADWDISKSHCLGPIPSNVLIGPPVIPNRKSQYRASEVGPVAPVSFHDLIHRRRSGGGPLEAKDAMQRMWGPLSIGAFIPRISAAKAHVRPVSALSNSHKKVIEMRNKGKRPETEIEGEPPVSPQPEFVP